MTTQNRRVQAIRPETPTTQPTPKVDMVNHPPHYQLEIKGNRVECIDVIETLNLPYNHGVAFSYLWRAQTKNGLEDLEKAAFHLHREIRKQGGKVPE